MRSIFDSLVNKENDHTNLLRNVMERVPEAAATILNYLVGIDISAAEAKKIRFRTQYSFRNPDALAIPDLFVQGQDFRCLIEAKISSEIPMTPAQAAGYKECFEPVGKRYLCFLVTEDWKHSKFVDEIRIRHEGEIDVHLRSWRELVEKLEEALGAQDNSILVE